METNTQPAAQTTTEVSYLGLMGAIVILLIAIAGVAWYIYTGMQNTPMDQMVVEPEVIEPVTASESPTSEQKLEVLNSLQANPSNLSREEKRAILEQL